MSAPTTWQGSKGRGTQQSARFCLLGADSAGKALANWWAGVRASVSLAGASASRRATELSTPPTGIVLLLPVAVANCEQI